jgi:hypothetical protein
LQHAAAPCSPRPHCRVRRRACIAVSAAPPAPLRPPAGRAAPPASMRRPPSHHAAAPARSAAGCCARLPIERTGSARGGRDEEIEYTQN